MAQTFSLAAELGARLRFGRSVEFSAEACQTRCQVVPECSHFTFWPDGGCLLTGEESREGREGAGGGGPGSLEGDQKKEHWGKDEGGKKREERQGKRAADNRREGWHFVVGRFCGFEALGTILRFLGIFLFDTFLVFVCVYHLYLVQYGLWYHFRAVGSALFLFCWMGFP